MKKNIIALAVLATMVMACDKAENAIEDSENKNVSVNLEISMAQKLTRCNFNLTDPSNPIGGLSVSWQENDRITLIIFQGDNASWRSNFIYQDVTLPAAAEGQDRYDVSSLFGTLDLSSFDSSKDLKYVVVLSTNGGFSSYFKEFSIFGGNPQLKMDASISEQIHMMKMIADTDVQEVAFPTDGKLNLKGQLRWVTSVLAVQFTIDPEADIDYPSDSFLYLKFNNAKITLSYYPITKEISPYKKFSRGIYFQNGGKLSDALDANHCRYFSIPADDMTTDPDQKLGGATLGFTLEKGSTTEYTTTGSIATDAVIEAGKVYGLRFHVTDADHDGKPEFTKY